jgi:hypothetical protein
MYLSNQEPPVEARCVRFGSICRNAGNERYNVRDAQWLAGLELRGRSLYLGRMGGDNVDIEFA